MSCPKCEACQEQGISTFVRVGRGNVLISGCDEHLAELLGLLRAALDAERNG